MTRLFRALFGSLVVTQMLYGKLARLRTPAGTKAIVGLLLGASSAEAVSARGRGRGAAESRSELRAKPRGPAPSRLRRESSAAVCQR